MFKRFLLLFVLLGLFYLSSTSQILVSDPSTWTNGQHRDESADLSHIFDENSVFFDTYFEDDKTVEDLGFEFYIRKFFHVGAYGVLALIIFWNLPKIKLRYSLSFLLTAFISFVDEANQYTTFGRSGRLWDVFLDSSAAFVALLLLLLIRIILHSLSYFSKKKDKKIN